SGRSLHGCWLCWLVLRGAAARGARVRTSRGENTGCSYQPPAGGSSGMDNKGAAPRTTSSGNLSDFGGYQRRLGRKCSDGRPGSPLWNYQRQGHVVSDQSFGRWVNSGAVDHRSNLRVSLERLDHRHDHSLGRFFARRASLWRRASDVSAPTDSAWRRDRPYPLDGSDP